MKHIDCKAIAQNILDHVKSVKNKKGLVIFTVGDNPASASYVKGKIKDCEYCGIPCKHITLDDTHETVFKLHDLIEEYNDDDNYSGIIVQLPLPDQFYAPMYTNSVVPIKDVDGFNDRSPHPKCTPEAVVRTLVHEYGNLRALAGKRALIVGRGELVGRPLIDELLNLNCTVTVAHSKTTNLDELLSANDIIISAAGKANLIDLKKCNAEVVIDVGVNRDANGKLVGDCFNFDPNDGSDMKVTPVPGGIGLLTRAVLMENTMEAMMYM